MKTCHHLHGLCASWEECATRLAKDSAKRAEDFLAYANELTHLHRELEVIAAYLSDTEDDSELAITKVYARVRKALAEVPNNVVLVPPYMAPEHKSNAPPDEHGP